MMFRLILHCKLGNCLTIINQINHGDGLIRINVLILTALKFSKQALNSGHSLISMMLRTNVCAHSSDKSKLPV